MPTKTQLSWQGIENTERNTDDFRVWLVRPHPSEQHDKDAPWLPLRHQDCRALRAQYAKHAKNSNNDNDDMHPVYIEGGRATADPVANLVFYNFFRGPQRALCSAVWFARNNSNSDHHHHESSTSPKKATTDEAAALTPIMNQDDQDKIESLYQNTCILLQEDTPNGTQDIMSASPTIVLSDQSKVKVVVTNNGKDILLRRQAGWFGHVQTLQRGYGPYTVPGEAEENMLGPVQSLVFVIHGIGEAYFSRQESQIPGMIEQTNQTRIALQKHQVQAYQKTCEAAKKQNQPAPSRPARIELLPIEWFGALHNEQSALMQNLNSVTLQSIPALRSIANDIIFDVLVYLTPPFCQAVLTSVTDQVKSLYAAFGKVHPDFVPNGGQTSLIGHSLGSVIVWDLLALQHDYDETQQQKQKQQSNPSSATVGVTIDGATGATAVQHSSTWGPTVPNRSKWMESPPLPFRPTNVVLLGSPLGMFLSLRGAHEVFEQIRTSASSSSSSNNDDNPPLISPFTLPVQRFVNIFNASDPVAYRIEPLLVSTATQAKMPPPAYLTAPGKDVRLHVKARQIGDGVRKALLEQTTSTWSSLLGAVATAASSSTNEAVSKNRNASAATTTTTTTTTAVPTEWKFPLGGTSDRVDYAFQPAWVENEYISAVLAHSTTGYFLNADFLDYMAHTMVPGNHA